MYSGRSQARWTRSRGPLSSDDPHPHPSEDRSRTHPTLLTLPVPSRGVKSEISGSVYRD